MWQPYKYLDCFCVLLKLNFQGPHYSETDTTTELPTHPAPTPDA